MHEGGYQIRKDFQGRWYFRRPDGRAVPRCGYQPEDMIDEGGASAEAPKENADQPRRSSVMPSMPLSIRTGSVVTVNPMR